MENKIFAAANKKVLCVSCGWMGATRLMGHIEKGGAFCRGCWPAVRERRANHFTSLDKLSCPQCGDPWQKKTGVSCPCGYFGLPSRLWRRGGHFS